MISARRFNEAILKPLSRGRLLPGARTQVTRTRLGQCLRMRPTAKWRHPWYTSLTWLGAEQKWVATIKPGFVNGHAPVVLQSVQEAQVASSGGDYGINPLTGRPFFEAWIKENPGSSSNKSTIISTPLYFNPSVNLSWRNIGWDGPGEPVPGFFKNLGVNVSPSAMNVDNLGNLTLSATTTPPRGNRLLRACDLVLHQPRTALSSVVSYPPGLITGQSLVTQTLTLSPQMPGDQLKVLSLPKYDPWNIYNQAIDPLAGQYTEPPWDETPISTVYLLSDPDVDILTPIDQTWHPYVQHHLFWNLNYGQPPFANLAVTTGLGLVQPLYGGLGQLVINFLTASLNDMTSNALNILTGNSMAGSFWAATGGGSDSSLPAAPAQVTAGATGLDKDAIAIAKRQAQIDAVKNAKLDPVFPYNSPQFPISLLT